MENLNIKIQTLEDSKNEIRIFPDIPEEKVLTSKSIRFGILEDMTTEHKSAVSIVIENENGTFSHHLVTENLMNGFISAFEGAKKRFEDLRAKRN